MSFDNKGMITALAAGLFFAFGPAAKAIPVLGTIDIAGNYSLLHGIPIDPSDDWLWFDADQSINLDLDGGILTLAGAQTYSVASNNGATATIEFTDLMFDLNDSSDGFVSGTLDYLLNGAAGQFVFTNTNYSSSPFNSSIIDGRTLSVFAWGGDSANGIGIDLGLTGLIPEPGTVLLLGIGLFGLLGSRRR